MAFNPSNYPGAVTLTEQTGLVIVGLVVAIVGAFAAWGWLKRRRW